MGAKRYGDCLVCRIAGKRILIDGGHLGDQRRGDPRYPSIPEQLQEILGQAAPWHFDLLVVTHTHVDHIGCLPNLVSNSKITAEWILAADEALGWGEVNAADAADAPVSAAAPELVREALALLREERPAFASRGEMEAFAADAARMRPGYTAMLQTLAAAGTVVRFGKDDPAALLAAFQDTGLKILGPSREHLLICARQIAALGRDAADAADAAIGAVAAGQDAHLDLVSLYEALRQRPGVRVSPDSGDFDLGNAINDQSLVLSFEVGGRKILLTGDMQLADPLVPGLDEAMAVLRRTIVENGPYMFVKLPHHGARNAVDAAVLTESRAVLFAISGGYGSAKHPHPSTLDVLGNTQGITWYRTDRNGLISVDLARPELEVEWVRGDPNDLGRNPAAPDFLDERPEPAVAARPAAEVRRAVVTPDGEFVEVLARVPHRRTRVVISIDVEPLDESRTVSVEESPRKGDAKTDEPRPVARPLRVGGDRILPPLLFATDPDALAANVGREEARSACKALEASGHAFLFDSFRKMTSERAGVQIRDALGRGGQIEGLVLVGGYDVIPPDSVDVLSAAHRKALDPRYDQDRFLVWSDDYYADLDDDGFPELPVSRVPDGRSAHLLHTALAAPYNDAPKSRAGLRNLKRPFAQAIFDTLPGDAQLLQSHPASPDTISSNYLAAEAIYVMLHGRASNARTFLGETDSDELFEAIDHRNLCPCPGAVAFTGCCWGALIVETTAWTHDPHEAFAPRSPEASLALGFLASGANAFIGCTGLHYSPKLAPYNYASGPFHQAFWQHLIVNRLRPAAALLEAKRTYRRGMPYPNPIPGEDPGAAAAAVEKKLLAQFTCLGLGW